MNFSTWLVMQLHRHKLYQSEFATQTGFHRQTIVKWVTDQTLPGATSISRLAEWFASHEINPWDSTTNMKLQFYDIMMNLVSDDFQICPLCGEVEAKPNLDE